MATDLLATHGTTEFLERAGDQEFVKIISCEHSRILGISIVGSCQVCMEPNNITKNRSWYIPCFDISRVVLLDTKDGSDYINASYVNGFDIKKKFIVTELPMANTLDNFWSMVWQQNTRVIVMLTSTEEESRPNKISYFPYNQHNTIWSDFLVTEDEIKSKHYYVETVLSFVYKNTGEIRTIHHFKFLNWPENKVPEVEGFLEFLLAVNKQFQEFARLELMNKNKILPGPITVHGNAGIGRTTTFCAIDICLYQLVYTGTISVPSVVLAIRQQRNASISALDYYKFINYVLLYFLVTIKSKHALFFELRSHLTEKDMMLFNHPLANIVLTEFNQ